MISCSSVFALKFKFIHYVTRFLRFHLKLKRFLFKVSITEITLIFMQWHCQVFISMKNAN